MRMAAESQIADGDEQSLQITILYPSFKGKRWQERPEIYVQDRGSVQSAVVRNALTFCFSSLSVEEEKQNVDFFLTPHTTEELNHA